MKKITFSLLVSMLVLVTLPGFGQKKVICKPDFQGVLGENIYNKTLSNIYRAALSGKLRICKFDSLKSQMSVTDLNTIVNSEETVTIFPDPNDPNFSRDSIVRHQVTEKDLKGFHVSLRIVPDPSFSNFSASVAMIGVAANLVLSGYDLGESAIFWFTPADLTSVLPTDAAVLFNAIPLSFRSMFNDQSSHEDTALFTLNLEKFMGLKSLKTLDRSIYNGAVHGKLDVSPDKTFSRIMQPAEITMTPSKINSLKVGEDLTVSAETAPIVPVSPDSINLHKLILYLDFGSSNLDFNGTLLGLAFYYRFYENNNTTREAMLYAAGFKNMERYLNDDSFNPSKISFIAMVNRIDLYGKK